jgi:hypothetical protein
MIEFAGCVSCGASAITDANFYRNCGNQINRDLRQRASCCGEVFTVRGMKKAHYVYCGSQLILVNFHDNSNLAGVGVGLKS